MVACSQFGSSFRIIAVNDSVGGEAGGQLEHEEKLPDLPLLSEQLLLDELWDMLGECLKELEESHDQHAVLGTEFHTITRYVRGNQINILIAVI